MSWDFVIKDGYGAGNKLKINSEGELFAVVHPHPPRDEKVSSVPFQVDFANASNVTDMRVDGSTTNVDFYISADTKKDVYIKCLSFVVADASSTLNKFGNLAALSNGLRLSWVTNDIGTQIIADNITTNFKLVRLSLGNPAYGSGTSAFLASNVSSTSEAYFVVIDFSMLFGLQYGLRLRAGTNDKIVWTIRDNVTGVDQLDCIAYGIKI